MQNLTKRRNMIIEWVFRSFGSMQQKRAAYPKIGSQMGEEKPEEELMGKRKSSPRFDNIIIDAVIYYVFLLLIFYTLHLVFFAFSFACSLW